MINNDFGIFSVIICLKIDGYLVNLTLTKKGLRSGDGRMEATCPLKF